MTSSDEDGAFTSSLTFIAAGSYNVSIGQFQDKGGDQEWQRLLSDNLTVQAGLPDPFASSVDGPGLYNAVAGQTAMFWV